MKKRKEDSKISKVKVKWCNIRGRINKFFDQHFDPIVFFIIMFIAASIYMMASVGIKDYKSKYVCTQSIETICTDVSSKYDEDDGMKYYQKTSRKPLPIECLRMNASGRIFKILYVKNIFQKISYI